MNWVKLSPFQVDTVQGPRHRSINKYTAIPRQEALGSTPTAQLFAVILAATHSQQKYNEQMKLKGGGECVGRGLLCVLTSPWQPSHLLWCPPYPPPPAPLISETLGTNLQVEPPCRECLWSLKYLC